MSITCLWVQTHSTINNKEHQSLRNTGKIRVIVSHYQWEIPEARMVSHV